MPLVHSSLLPEAFVLFWKIARHVLTPTYIIITLTGIPANEGERTNDRVVGTPGEDTRRITSTTCFRRRRRGTGEATDPGTVSLAL